MRQPTRLSDWPERLTVTVIFSAVAPASVARVSDTVFRVTFPAQTAPGDYTLSVGPDIRDAAGNRLDQDGDGTPGEPAADVFTITAPSGGSAYSRAASAARRASTIRWFT